LASLHFASPLSSPALPCTAAASLGSISPRTYTHTPSTILLPSTPHLPHTLYPYHAQRPLPTAPGGGEEGRRWWAAGSAAGASCHCAWKTAGAAHRLPAFHFQLANHDACFTRAAGKKTGHGTVFPLHAFIAHACTSLPCAYALPCTSCTCLTCLSEQTNPVTIHRQ